MSYLFAYYSFILSSLFYLFLIKILPLPVLSADSGLLPFYSPYSYPQSPKIIAYFLALALIGPLTLFLYALAKRFFTDYFNDHPRLQLFLSFAGFCISAFGVIFILYKSYASSVNITQLSTNYTYLFKPYFFLLSVPLFIFLVYAYIAPGNHLSANIKKISAGFSPFFLPAVIMLVFSTVFDRTMDEKNLFLGKTFQYVHSAVFVGPVSDILQGKVLLVDASAQYGLLLNYIPALVFKFLVPLSFTNFFYLMIFYGIVYYIAVFLLLKNRFQSPLWALGGLISLFSLHFYATTDRLIRPMFFPIRYMFDIPFFLLLFWAGKRKRFPALILSLYLAFAVFYNYETGISLCISYVLYIFLYGLIYLRLAFLRPRLAFIAGQITLLLAAIFSLGFIYSIYAFAVTGKLPSFPQSLFFVRLYGSGFIASNGPPVSFYIFTLLIYFAVMIKTAVRFLEKKLDKQGIFDSALAAYGLLIFIYYVERSYVPNISAVSIPAVILGIGLLKEIFHLRADKITKIALLPVLLSLEVTLIFAAVFYLFRFLNNPGFPYWQGDKTASAELYNRLEASARTISGYEKGKEAAVISFYDTFLTVKSGKTNSLPHNSYQNVFTGRQADDILNFIAVRKPNFIFTSASGWPEEATLPEVFKYIGENYRIIDTAEMLKVWKKI